tara:strand:+ start:591 stop:857 length:267 start_codon:yes stop_codon:yes gene_type:complete
MGKMKELHTRYLEEHGDNEHLDDEYHYEEWLKSQGYKPVTMEETQAQHDAWWNSLTEEQKQKLYEEQEAYEQDRIDNDMNGLNSQYGV